MGAAFAPNYAGLYMGLWEETHIHQDNNPFKACILWYGRYIDDLFFIFNGTELQLNEFHQYLNASNPNIQLSLDYSKTLINFLDLQITVDDNGQLHTTIYRKPSDRNTILRADSFHPQTLISNIPVGQFQRLKRICDSENSFELHSMDMYKRFQNRGYNKKILDNSLTKVNNIQRKDLLRKTWSQQKNSNKLFFSTPFGDLSYKIKNIIKKNWSILQSDPNISPLFQERPLFAFRRAPTIKDNLVRSHLPAEKRSTWLSQKNGTQKCGNCNHCHNIIKTDFFIDPTTQKTYKCKGHATCNTTYVVYRLECECGCFYIGRTKRKLKERLAEHKYAIRTNNMNYPMAKHYQQTGHSSPNSLKAFVIECVPVNLRGGDRLKLLLQRETYWIHTLNATVHPGLNEEIDFSPYL